MSFFKGPSTIRDGLVLAYDAASPRSYPGSGGTWYNLSGTALNASLNGGVSFSTANGGVMVMNGSTGVIYGPSVNSMGPIPVQTFEIWVKSPGLGPGKSIGGLICPDYGMTSYITGGGDVVYSLYNTDSSPYGSVTSLGSSGVNVFDNNWHHIVCTRNVSNMSIYIDGVSRGSTGGGTASWSGATVWSGMNTQIGNNPNDQYYNLNGSIAIARIYRIYFTSDLVLHSYNSQKSRFGL